MAVSVMDSPTTHALVWRVMLGTLSITLVIPVSFNINIILYMTTMLYGTNTRLKLIFLILSASWFNTGLACFLSLISIAILSPKNNNCSDWRMLLPDPCVTNPCQRHSHAISHTCHQTNVTSPVYSCLCDDGYLWKDTPDIGCEKISQDLLLGKLITFLIVTDCLEAQCA